MVFLFLRFVCIPIAVLSFFTASSQLVVSPQVRIRPEFRDGQGAPLPHGARPALFVSQRTRLGFNFSGNRVKVGATLQDVRVWGQDASLIHRNTVQVNNGMMFHEAWAELQLTDTSQKRFSLSLKLGRQELVYDDQRLLGNLDWLQQGRRHDALLLKFRKDSWSVDAAAAFNQNGEKSSGTIYNSDPPGYPASTNGGAMYKSMAYVYAGKALRSGSLSFLIFGDQFSRYTSDTSGGEIHKVFGGGSWSRFTTGFHMNTTARNNLGWLGGAYYQFGRNAAGEIVRAAMINSFVQYKRSRWNAGLGIDYTSGGNAPGRSNAFDPLYGTPHKFWGLMDYFYAGSPFGAGGLVDCFSKGTLSLSEKVKINLDLHHFASASGRLSSNGGGRSLGQEIDLTGTLELNASTKIEAGAARFFSTGNLTARAVKNIPDARRNANWIYVMININPKFLIK